MLSCNVLLNTSTFKSYDQYVCGTCALTAKQVERLLAFQVLDDEPSVLLPFNQWGICGTGSSKINRSVCRKRRPGCIDCTRVPFCHHNVVSIRFPRNRTTPKHCWYIPFDVQILPFDWISNSLDHDGAGSIAHDNSKEAANDERKNFRRISFL